MGGADKVELGRKLVSVAILGVEPVAGEDGQLTVLGELRQTLLQSAEVGVRGRAGCNSEVPSVSRIGLEAMDGVDVVERSQVVEPKDMAVQELSALDKVTDDTSVV